MSIRTNAFRSVSLRLASLAALAALGSPGCSSETGIVIEVSQEGLAIAPDSLRFFVGVELDDLAIAIPECGDALRFQDDATTADREVSVAGRDLASDPYRLLLRPGEGLAPDRDLMVVVAALAGNDVVGVGSLDGPVAFLDGKVLSWKIKLKGAAQDTVSLTSAGCICHRGADGLAVITPSGDADCDGDPDITDCNSADSTIGHDLPELCKNNVDDNCNGAIDEEVDGDGDGVLNCADCDDANPEVYPGAPEICDGLDNDCDSTTPRFTAEPIDCYARDSGDCWLGTRVCDDYDEANRGWQGECTPSNLDPHNQASDTMCDVFDQCTADGPYQDGVECTGQIFTVVSCELLVVDEGNQGSYSVCPNRLFLGEGIPPLSACRWILLGGVEQDGYTVGLRDPGDITDFGAVIESCQALAKVFESYAQFPDLPKDSSFQLWSEVDGQDFSHVRMDVHPRVVVDPAFVCPLNGLQCTVVASP